jgi:predicted RNA-binding protein YlxR (DUF448 family)
MLHVLFTNQIDEKSSDPSRCFYVAPDLGEIAEKRKNGAIHKWSPAFIYNKQTRKF